MVTSRNEGGIHGAVDLLEEVAGGEPSFRNHLRLRESPAPKGVGDMFMQYRDVIGCAGAESVLVIDDSGTC